jgi:hypothetical protein
MNHTALLLIVIVLCSCLFYFSSETANRLDSQRNFNYLNPVYIMNVFVAIGSSVTAAICIIDLHCTAERKIRERNLYRYYNSLRMEMYDDFTERVKANVGA